MNERNTVGICKEWMKPPRYIMFAGKSGESRGGWHDKSVSCGILKLIKDDYESMIKSNYYDWIHIVDLYSREIIMCADRIEGELKDITEEYLQSERDHLHFLKWRYENRTEEEKANDEKRYQKFKEKLKALHMERKQEKSK